ncbi:MAG TPA: LacI family DNA-binding transcriptional regulator [Chthonomonadales bacterium]|nr:LacI family DNA-binding transcriptional regulator [Chthonomonadales bacterium]
MPARMRSTNGVTLRRIAQRAGCAVSVVSTVLNGARGNTGVSDDLRRRVQRCAEELDYEANYHARALRVGRAATIGLVYQPGDGSALHERFFTPLMAGVEQAVRAAGSDLLVVGPSGDEAELDRGLHYCRQGRVDALVAPGLVYSARMQWLDSWDAPIAVALSQVPTRHPLVVIDERPGIAEAVRHLASMGHRELLWIGLATDGEERDHDRAATLRAEAEAAGLRVRRAAVDLPSDCPDEIEAWLEVAEAGALRLLDGSPLPTAIVAYNELVASGACAALAGRGLRVPRDVSVVGFDDITACVASPPMTVVSLGLRQVGATAAALALEMAGDPDARRRLAGQSVAVPTRLVVRRSTGPARTAGASEAGRRP